MELLIVRHAIAVERGAPGLSDDARPLSPEGRDKVLPSLDRYAAIVAKRT